MKLISKIFLLFFIIAVVLFFLSLFKIIWGDQIIYWIRMAITSALFISISVALAVVGGNK